MYIALKTFAHIPSTTGEVVTFFALIAEQASRTENSQESNKWDSECCFGSLHTLAINARRIDRRNGVDEYSSSTQLQSGAASG